MKLNKDTQNIQSNSMLEHASTTISRLITEVEDRDATIKTLYSKVFILERTLSEVRGKQDCDNGNWK